MKKQKYQMKKSYDILNQDSKMKFIALRHPNLDNDKDKKHTLTALGDSFNTIDGDYFRKNHDDIKVAIGIWNVIMIQLEFKTTY